MKKLIMTTLTAVSLVTVASSEAAGAGRENPLLQPWPTAFEVVPFDRLTPADYENAVIEGIARQRQEIDAIVNQRSVPTFENTIVALDRSGRDLNLAILALSNVEHANGDTALMNAMSRVTPLLSQMNADMMLNERLFDRVRQVYERRGELTDLTPEQQRLITETYRGFAENGATLKGEDREKYRRLNSELSDLTLRFAQNVTNDMQNPDNRMWVTTLQTAGLPESIRSAARAEAKAALEAEGKEDNEDLYLFTMFMPSYSPFIKYADDRGLREKLYRMYTGRNQGGANDNLQVLKDIVNVRMELAQLLGNKTFADYQLQGTMAKNPEGVYKLLNQLREAYTEPMRAELAEIEQFARATEGEDFELKPWDYSYWSDKLKNARYSFNDEDMKPYFELNNTIDGVFGLATRLYGYTFKQNKDIPVYHDDASAYEVYGPDGKILGVLYADFFYRPGKSPGAWMTEYRTEVKDDEGNRTIPLISIVMNFSRPVGNDPVLLTPYEVETFLHEFGHALHGLSSEATYSSLSGTNVYHDFVELPSQFNENYLTEKKFLDTFAKHYKTGKKMPQELIDRFIKSSQFGAAYACMRQLNFGFLDMAYYTQTEPMRASASIPDFEQQAIEPVKIFDMVDGSLISPTFAHVFSGGYGAGYYGYKWAEVLDADAFAAFKKAGIFDKKTAARFRKLLQSGGTVDPMELYIEFRGQEPTVDALLERDGIKK